MAINKIANLARELSEKGRGCGNDGKYKKL
jgi:hypothetical protein